MTDKSLAKENGKALIFTFQDIRSEEHTSELQSPY